MDVARSRKHLVHKLSQAGFNTNYITYRNVETMPQKNHLEEKIVKETWESFLPYIYNFYFKIFNYV